MLILKHWLVYLAVAGPAPAPAPPPADSQAMASASVADPSGSPCRIRPQSRPVRKETES